MSRICAAGFGGRRSAAFCHTLAASSQSLAAATRLSYNALLARLSRSGLFSDALHLFDEMRKKAFAPDHFTLPPVLNSAAHAAVPGAVPALHALSVKSALAPHLWVSNALVDAYAKLGRLNDAVAVFEAMGVKDVVSWTSVITGLAHSGEHDAALRVYRGMVDAGVCPDEIVTAAALSACAGATLLQLGQSLHSATVHLGSISFLSVGNALVSMYAKTGLIDDAQAVFAGMPRRCTVTWTALIVGYAQNGRGGHSVRVYDEMLRSGCRPDYVTFIGVLFACSHAGLVDIGLSHFNSMEAEYGVTPGPDHHACMVDMLGRSGRLDEAVALLRRQSPAGVDAAVWKSLLAACRAHWNVGLAETAAGAAAMTDPSDAVPYIMLSNLYAAARRWDDAARMRAALRSHNALKLPGFSWIVIAGVPHAFAAEESDSSSHPRLAEIYGKVREMTRRIAAEAGYEPDPGWWLHGNDGGGAGGLAWHSERLAVALGLLELPPAVPVRVYKNLRICGDCHVAMKMVSAVYGRTIVMRDGNCFHHIKDGACSCGDFW